MSHVIPRRASGAVAAALCFFCPVRAQHEVRALWVVRTTLASPSAIATMVSAAKSGGLNPLLLQGRGPRAPPFHPATTPSYSPGRPAILECVASPMSAAWSLAK